MYGSSTGVLSPNNQGRKRRPFAPEDDEETMLSIIAYLSSPSKPKSLLMYSRQLPAFSCRQLRSNILEGQKEEMLYCGRYQSFWMMCAQLSIAKFPRTEEENPCLYIQHPQVSIAYLQNQKSHLHHQAEQVLMQRLSSTSLRHL